MAPRNAYVPVPDTLISTVKACLVAEKTDARLLLNKVKARGLHPSEQEFKAALNKLAASGIATKCMRRLPQRVEFWGLSR